MSETDEGSNGFELLDDDTLESNTTPPKPKSAAVRSKVKNARSVASTAEKVEKLSLNETKVNRKHQQPQREPRRQQQETTKPPAPVQLESLGSATTQEPKKLAEGQQVVPAVQSDSDDGGGDLPINAEMVWSGLQWGASFLSKVTEKAKESVDKVITTLDPQMKPLIFSGGDLTVVVASDKKDKVMPIQDAFWDVFGRATVEGVKAQPSSMAAQPVGFTAGLKAAEDRVNCLQSAGEIDPMVPVVAVEGFLAELSSDRWFDMSCVLLVDKANDISLSVYTQATPIDEQWINQIKDGTPPDYPLSWCGFAKTIGEVAAASLDCERNEWHEKHTGIPRCASIYQSAKSLAFLYQKKLQDKVLAENPLPSLDAETTNPASVVSQ